jgi:UPF0755 protein
MRRGRIALALVALILIGGAVAGYGVLRALRSLDAPIALQAPLRFEIAPGERLSQVAKDLAQRGVLEEPRAWVLYARLEKQAGSIKAGEYQIEPQTTPRALLEKLVSGQVLLHSFTIVDGWRVEDLLAALRHDGDLLVMLPAAPEHLMQSLGYPEGEAEGQFLPETYRFALHTRDVEVLREAHELLVKTLDAEWAARDPSIPLHTPEELLIMASIVEKESGVPGELGRIAGLYLNRLSIGMRLQADPTVIYGLGDRYDGELHTVDLRTDGPYNTYTRAGLPPTPIALPGAAALHATAHPEKTDALYFVASGKSDGSHVFSHTLEQHNLAVAQYLARQRHKASETPP